jgi:phosphoribosyl 1,2-cyclic phosphodiesterase
MSQLELCILASGSSGNASLLRSPAGVVLVDAGIGPRTVAKRLVGTGTLVTDVRAIVLTHLDTDHFNHTWESSAIDRGIGVYVHASRHEEFIERCTSRAAMRALVVPFDGVFTPLPGLDFRAISLAHDSTGSHGFVICGFGSRIGYATDLGHVPAYLLEAFRALDILAIEANYDLDMQMASARPFFLKKRIVGGSGHLSNEQALAAVRQVFDRAQAVGEVLPGHVVLLHRSRQCNCPVVLRNLFGGDPRIGPRLTLSHQGERTEWLRPRAVGPHADEQLTLSWA